MAIGNKRIATAIKTRLNISQGCCRRRKLWAFDWTRTFILAHVAMTAMKPIYYYRANQIMLALTLGAFCLKLQMTALYLRLTEQSVLTLSSKNNFVFIHSFLFPQKLQNETLNAQSSHKVLGNLSLCF